MPCAFAISPKVKAKQAVLAIIHKNGDLYIFSLNIFLALFKDNILLE